MPVAMPFLGIDFGTSGSKIAWYNPRTKQAEIIRNAEGKEQTPSVIYIGRNRELLIGKTAEKMLELESERLRVVTSVKRQLVMKQCVTFPNGKIETIQLAAEIFRKLKHDAETLHFHQTVLHAVITVPATFTSIHKERIRRAAELAGFRYTQLLEEPAAAALAYMYQSPDVGRRVLVYDLGGGTFDLALVAREPEGTFRRIVRSRGEAHFGGDDIDDALYNYCDRLAQQTLGHSLNIDGQRDLAFLRKCREWKEELSHLQQLTLHYTFESEQELQHFDLVVTRAEFETLIQPTIQKTVSKTQELLKEDLVDGHTIDSIVLIGGSTRIPLVQRLLSQALSMQPLAWEARDFAVALGAAHYANLIWKPENQYRWAIEAAWKNKNLTVPDVARMGTQAQELALSKELAAQVERSVMGETKEIILAQQQGMEQYRRTVMSEFGAPLTPALVGRLADQANKLGLNQAQAATVERSILGGTKEERLAYFEALTRYRQEVERIMVRGLDRNSIARLADFGQMLGLSQEEVAKLEREEIGDTKEMIFAYQLANERYTSEVRTAWKEGWLNEQKVARLKRVASQLPLNLNELERIERSVMGGTKEEILQRQQN